MLQPIIQSRIFLYMVVIELRKLRLLVNGLIWSNIHRFFYVCEFPYTNTFQTFLGNYGYEQITFNYIRSNITIITIPDPKRKPSLWYIGYTAPTFKAADFFFSKRYGTANSQIH